MTDQAIYGCLTCRWERQYGTARPTDIQSLTPTILCAKCDKATMHKFIGMVWESPDRYSKALGE